MIAVRVVGIGSPYGDDRAGLEAARRLARRPPPGCAVTASARPSADLLGLIDGPEPIIVIDAVRSGAPAGAILDLALADVGRAGIAAVSSHGIAIGEVLALAAALGRPPTGRFVGVVAGPSAGYEAPLSPAVEAALAALLRRVRRWAAALRAGASAGYDPTVDGAADSGGRQPRGTRRPRTRITAGAGGRAWR